jgi:lysozyme
MRRFGLMIVILLVVLGMTAFLWAPRWTPSRSAYPLQGIDVSAHQGEIDWAALPAQGVDFAYIKATEGGDFRDKAFARNWAGAAGAGIRQGAYHFFTLCRSGTEQAANFIRAVPVDGAGLPPAVDLEYLGNCGRRPTREQLHKELGDYLRLVEARYGRAAVLYLTQEFDRAYGITAAFDRPVWLRSIIFEPDFGSYNWTLWQASNFRRLEGVRGRVDWNALRTGLHQEYLFGGTAWPCPRFEPAKCRLPADAVLRHEQSSG